jgi:hypothetical protein
LVATSILKSSNAEQRSGPRQRLAKIQNLNGRVWTKACTGVFHANVLLDRASLNGSYSALGHSAPGYQIRHALLHRRTQAEDMQLMLSRELRGQFDLAAKA